LLRLVIRTWTSASIVILPWGVPGNRNKFGFLDTYFLVTGELEIVSHLAKESFDPFAKNTGLLRSHLKFKRVLKGLTGLEA
jgi:hypothetical protein